MNSAVMERVNFVMKMAKPAEPKTEHHGCVSVWVPPTVGKVVVVRSVGVSRWRLHGIAFGIHALGIGSVIARLGVA
jgi:hypothetical protein